MKTPNPYSIAQKRFSPAWEQSASHLLHEKFSHHLALGESIQIEALEGPNAAFLKVFVGFSQKANVFELFLDSLLGSDIESSFGLLLDYLDGVLEEFFACDRDGGLPLNFVRVQFEHAHLWVRQEFRDFEAERLADDFLKAADNKKPAKKV